MQPGAFSARAGSPDHRGDLEELGVGSCWIQGLKKPDGSRRELDVVALVKVHGRAATNGIESIDAGLAGHEHGAGGMGLAQAVVREARASRPAGGGPAGGAAPLAGAAAAAPLPRRLADGGQMPHRGCMRQGAWGRSGHDWTGGDRQARMLETDPIKRVGGRGSRRRRLEEARGGAQVGLEPQGLWDQSFNP